MYVFNHEFGRVLFHTEMDLWVPWLEQSHCQSFIHDETEPDVTLRLSCIIPDSLNQPILDPQTITQLSHTIGFNLKSIDSPLLRSEIIQKRLREICNYPEQASVEIKSASVVIFNFFQRELHLYFACRDGHDYTGCRLGPALFAPFLVGFNAAIIHCAGLIFDNSAALFMAPDEGGKTTVVNLADTRCSGILSDDQVILRQTNGKFIAHGTPWSRFTDGPISTKLGGLFLLEKAEKFELSPLKIDDALEYLWNEHQANWTFLPKTLRLQAFDFLLTVCHQIPIYRMRFPNDYVDWDAIDAVMVK